MKLLSFIAVWIGISSEILPKFQHIEVEISRPVLFVGCKWSYYPVPQFISGYHLKFYLSFNTYNVSIMLIILFLWPASYYNGAIYPISVVIGVSCECLPEFQNEKCQVHCQNAVNLYNISLQWCHLLYIYTFIGVACEYLSEFHYIN